MLLTAGFGGCAAHLHELPPAPVELNQHLRPSTSAELSAFLHALAAQFTNVAVLAVGTSVNNQPLEVLLVPAVGRAFAGTNDLCRPLTFFLLGTQHGMEPAGGEALALLARALAAQPDPHAQFIIMPDVNPDGRDVHRRVNANRVNLSTDFLDLSQPETRAVMRVLRTFRPHVLLDVHESAALKKHSLGAEGFLIDFETQFEPANNPNVDQGLRVLMFHTLLPEVLQRVQRTGVPAQRYLGEITSTTQTLTHGGLSLRNLRNMAGVMGTCAFLLENKLDASTGTYPTPRNLAARVQKQLISIRAFCQTCIAHREQILATTASARELWDNPPLGHTVWLSWRYIPARTDAQRIVPLVRITDGAQVQLAFPYHGMIEPRDPVSLPRAYLIPLTHRRLAWLQQHRFALEGPYHGYFKIPTSQPGGLLLPLVLEATQAGALPHALPPGQQRESTASVHPMH